MPGNYFDERIAATYEVKWPELFEPAVVEPAVSFLADLARSGSALELGIGTGRIALPLSRRGVRVHGIELSPAMIARLQAKPGADRIGVTIGDFTTAKVDGTFGLAYLVRNTIMNVTTQDGQVECFRNVAAQLEPGGCFVIEVIVPELQRLPPGEKVRAFTVTPRHLGFDEYDIAAQGLVSHHYWVVNGELETFSAPFRYVWPAELDLMARLAGMTLRERWSDWKREPFTSDSRSHISVWQKSPPSPPPGQLEAGVSSGKTAASAPPSISMTCRLRSSRRVRRATWRCWLRRRPCPAGAAGWLRRSAPAVWYEAVMWVLMSAAEREEFLAGVHVGVLSAAVGAARRTLAVPVWYSYPSPG